MHGIKSERFNQEIEYLRALAVGMVLFLHINFLIPGGSGAWRILSTYITGWAGVDLFFCISGFVISKSLVEMFDQMKGAGKWHVAAQAFWIRRFFRIAPSAWLWLAVPLIFSIAFNETSEWNTPHDNVKAIVAVVLNLANIVGIQNIAPDGIYWSLSLEEQFYLLYPFFLLFVPIAWRWRCFLLAIALQVLPDREALLYSPWWMVRLDAIMWGCVIYQFSKSPHYLAWEPTFLRSRPIAFALSILLLSLVMLVPTLLTGYIRVASVIAIICAALVFIASFQRCYLLPVSGLARSFLLWAGSRSFAIYLIHMPAIFITHEIWVRFDPQSRSNHSYAFVMLLTWVVLVAALSELNYRFIETPMRRRGAEIAKRIISSRGEQTERAVQSGTTDQFDISPMPVRGAFQ